MRKLTPSQHKHLKTITEKYDHGTPLDHEKLRSTLFGSKRNTHAAVGRAVNALLDSGFIGEQRRDPSEVALVYVPTDAGRAALTEHAVAEAGETE